MNKEPPNDNNPFGNPPFPGHTYADRYNWLGYLAQMKLETSPIYVCDYAVYGHIVQRMKGQVRDEFMPHAGKKPEYCPWESSNSLFSKSLGNKLSDTFVDRSE
jgi:hypothetical protein